VQLDHDEPDARLAALEHNAWRARHDAPRRPRTAVPGPQPVRRTPCALRAPRTCATSTRSAPRTGASDVSRAAGRAAL